jgi:hypothetical protein
MSLKSLSKTRWKTDTDVVTVYPFGLYFILGAVLSVIFMAIVLVYVNYTYPTTGEAVSLAIFLLFIAFLFGCFGSLKIEFDNHSGVMRRKLLGFIPFGSVRFHQLQGIDVVMNLAGSYSYKMFKKNERYGKGITVSSSYGKNDDPNAIAFVNEVIPIIHAYLDQHDVQPIVGQEPVLTSYQYFIDNGGSFELKNKKIGAIIFGLFFIGIGIWMLTSLDNSFWSTLILAIVMLFFGLVFFNAAFTRIVISKSDQTVQRVSPFGLGNVCYRFLDFAGIQTVRKSVNFAYAGTEVQLFFNLPDKNKQEVLVISSLRRSHQIERFLLELNQIIGRVPLRY